MNKYINKISVLQGVIVLLILYTLFAIIISGMTSMTYQQKILQASKLSAESLVGNNINQIIQYEINNHVDNIAAKLKAQLKKHNDLYDASVSETLNYPFSQKEHTAKFVLIDKIVLYDKDFNRVAISDKGLVDGFAVNQKLKEAVLNRDNKEQLMTFRCFYKVASKLRYSNIYPVGGMQLQGYLEVLLDFEHNMASLEKNSNIPIKLYNDGYQVYISSNWPANEKSYSIAGKRINALDATKNIEVLLALDNSKVISASKKTTWFYLWLNVLVGVGLFVIANMVIRRYIVQPIKRIIDYLYITARGNLTLELDTSGMKEFNTIAKHLNKHSCDLSKNLAVSIKSCYEFINSANKVSELSFKGKDGIDQQSKKVEEIYAISLELKKSIDNIFNSAYESLEQANKSKEQVNQGVSKAHKTIESTNALAASINDSKGVIQNLYKEANDITSIINVILEISDQTNLLALNAAIEAARAGDVGRGFAVVAEEVRNLATSTQESANNIQEMIKSLQNVATQVVKSMDSNSEIVQNFVTDITDTVAEIELISSSISEITKINKFVEESTKNQSIATENINQHIHEINVSSQQNKDLIMKTADHSDDLRETAENLEKILNKFKLKDFS